MISSKWRIFYRYDQYPKKHLSKSKFNPIKTITKIVNKDIIVSKDYCIVYLYICNY